MSSKVLILSCFVAASWSPKGLPAPIPLAEGGRTSHTIVVARDAPAPDRRAADELARFLGEVSGAAVPVKTDGDPVQGPMICVGPSAKATAVAGDIDLGPLGREGYIIRAVPPHLVIIGGSPRGTLYGCYSFLEDELGCRWFTPGVSRIPKQPTIRIGALDRRFVPALEYRATDYPNSRDADWAARNKVNGTQTAIDAARGGKVSYSHFVHTFNALIPPDKYFDGHPEYFSEVDGKRLRHPTQLCLTNPDVLRLGIETVKRWIRDAPEATIFSVSQNDWHHYCQCATCAALAKEEGSQSGPLIHFVNGIADGIAGEHPEKAIDTLAYQYTRKPPVKVRPKPNVIVRLCSIECCFSHPLTTDPENASFVGDIAGWSSICDRLYIWDYVIDYAHSIMPFPNLYSLKPNIEFFIRNGVKGIYEEANYFSKGGEFAELRTWIIAKTLWDPSYDTDRAIDEFLAGYYEDAAGAIREYINLLHEKARSENIHFRIWTPPTAPLFTREVMDRARGLFDLAETSLRDKPAVLERVRVARLPIMYVEIAQKRAALKEKKEGVTGAEIRSLLDRFEAIARREGIARVREGGGGGLDEWLREMRTGI